MRHVLIIIYFSMLVAGSAFGQQSSEPPLAAAVTAISDVTTSQVGRTVIIRGIITAHEPAENSMPHRIRLLDDKGSLWVTINEAAWNAISFKQDIDQGTLITAKVIVQEVKGVISGYLNSPDWVRLGSVPAAVFQPKPPPPPRPDRKPFLGSVAAVFAALLALFFAARKSRQCGRAISDRNRIERMLTERQNQLEKLLGTGPVIFFSLRVTHGGHFKVDYVSENLQQLLGYPTREPSQHPGWWEENLHPEDRENVIAQQQAITNRGIMDVVYRFRHQDGSYRWIQDNRRLLRDDGGVPVEVVGYWMDVSNLKHGIRLRETFTTLGAKLSAVTTPKQAARIVLNTAFELFGWDAAGVDTYSEADDQFDAVLHMEQIDDRRKEILAPQLDLSTQSLARTVFNEGPRLERQDEQTTQNLMTFGESHQRSFSTMLAPIQRANKSMGLITIYSSKPHDYDEEDLQILQVLSNYCSAALDRTFAEANRLKAEEALRESEERYALALRGANDAIWDWDLRNNRTYFSPRWKTMLGYSEDEITKHPLEWLKRVHPEDVERVKKELEDHIAGNSLQFEIEHRVSHKDGSYRWMLIRGVAVRDQDGEAYRMAGSMTDITVRKEAEAQLHHGAYHDALTGLPNRLLFLDNLRRAIARGQRRDDCLFAVLFLDLDRFKIINDSLGHLIGDQLLINVARRLEGCVRPEDTVARLGGDEFTVLLQDILGEGDATRIAERIQEELVKPVSLSGHEVYTTASIGISFSSSGYDIAEDMLRDADAAMYRAKTLGKARHAMFDTEMHSRAMALLQIEADLRRAIEREEFRLYYQPLLRLDTGRIIGTEALARWMHPERGLLLPNEFIPIAEETGLIIPIGWWVMRTACQQTRAWQKMQEGGGEPLTVAVNVSRKQFSEPDFIPKLVSILNETGLDGSSLTLEITEGTAMENAEFLTDMLARLKELKVQVHIDDFGTGYSSLSYLHQFPIDTLKIDKSFIAGISPGGGHRDIVRAIVTLADNLGLGVIAEGVETDEQLAELKTMNCQFTQGFLFCKPLDADNATDLILSRTVNVKF